MRPADTTTEPRITIDTPADGATPAVGAADEPAADVSMRRDRLAELDEA